MFVLTSLSQHQERQGVIAVMTTAVVIVAAPLNLWAFARKPKLPRWSFSTVPAGMWRIWFRPSTWETAAVILRAKIVTESMVESRETDAT